MARLLQHCKHVYAAVDSVLNLGVVTMNTFGAIRLFVSPELGERQNAKELSARLNVHQRYAGIGPPASAAVLGGIQYRGRVEISTLVRHYSRSTRRRLIRPSGDHPNNGLRRTLLGAKGAGIPDSPHRCNPRTAICVIAADIAVWQLPTKVVVANFSTDSGGNCSLIQRIRVHLDGTKVTTQKASRQARFGAPKDRAVGHCRLTPNRPVLRELRPIPFQAEMVQPRQASQASHAINQSYCIGRLTTQVAHDLVETYPFSPRPISIEELGRRSSHVFLRQTGENYDTSCE